MAQKQQLISHDVAVLTHKSQFVALFVTVVNFKSVFSILGDFNKTHVASS